MTTPQTGAASSGEAAPAPTWSALAPLPTPIDLGDYDRHDADDDHVRRQLHRLTDSTPWADLSWPDLITALLRAGRTDVPLSRLIEGHVDGLRILAQAGRAPVAGALYGVWASRSQQTGVRGVPVHGHWRTAPATSTDPSVSSNSTALRLDGTIRFASGVGVIDRALVPVWTGPDRHRLFDLDLTGLDQPSLELDTSSWSTAAMSASRSHTLALTAHVVEVSDQVGPDNFYLDRPQFFPGGVGVAACWLGGAARVADLVQTRMRPPLPPALQIRLGALRGHIAAGSAALHTAAEQLQQIFGAEHHPDGATALPAGQIRDGRPVSAETRWAVSAAVEAVLEQARHIAGPAGLAFDRDLTRAVHDLSLYVLQFNPDPEQTYLAGLQSPDR